MGTVHHFRADETTLIWACQDCGCSLFEIEAIKHEVFANCDECGKATPLIEAFKVGDTQ